MKFKLRLKKVKGKYHNTYILTIASDTIWHLLESDNANYFSHLENGEINKKYFGTALTGVWKSEVVSFNDNEINICLGEESFEILTFERYEEIKREREGNRTNQL